MNLDYESGLRMFRNIFFAVRFYEMFSKSCMVIDSALLENWDSSVGVDSQEGYLTSNILEYIDVVLMWYWEWKNTWFKVFFTKFSSSTISSRTREQATVAE